MTDLVRWILATRFRLVILAAVLVPIPVLGFVSTALMTMETLHRGPRRGLVSAVLATVAAVPLTWVWGGSSMEALAVCGALLLAGTGLGALLRRAGSLALAFQGVGLVCAAAAILAALLWPVPGGIVTSIVAQLGELASSAGATQQQADALVERWELFFVGLMTAGVFLQLMAALLLGSWSASRMQDESQFGSQFRKLRLGRLLGVPATLLMASSLLLDGPLIRNLFPVVLFAFWFQGTAVVHAWAWARRWNAAFLAPMYVLLFPPFMLVTVLVIASVGLVDNWIELRAPIRAQLDGRK